LGLIEDLGAGPVALDTAVFIYFIEEDQRFLPVVKQVFEGIDSGSLPATTSTLTLLETLVGPIRAGNHRLAEAYESLLSRSRGLHLLDLDCVSIRLAAGIRALAGLKTPDALQVASALQAGCSAFLTNDRQIPSIGDMRTLQLRDYL
jgi:predicted nucleic acid-binding protein